MNEKFFIELYNKKTDPSKRVLVYQVCSRSGCDGYDFCFECGGAGGYSVPSYDVPVNHEKQLSENQLQTTSDTINKIKEGTRGLTDNENEKLLQILAKLISYPRSAESKRQMKLIMRIRSIDRRRKIIEKVTKFITSTHKIEIDLAKYNEIYIKSKYSKILIPNHGSFYWIKPSVAKLIVTKNKVVIFDFGTFFQFLRTLAENANLSFPNPYTIKKEHYPIEELNNENFIAFNINGKHNHQYFIIAERKMKNLLIQFINKLGNEGVQKWYYEKGTTANTG